MVHGQTARIGLFQRQNTSNTQILYFGVGITDVSNIRARAEIVDL